MLHTDAIARPRTPMKPPAGGHLSLELDRLNRIAGIEALGTAIAHEVVQPITAATSLAGAARRWLDHDASHSPEAMQAIDALITELDRATEIARSVCRMAASGGGQWRELSPADLALPLLRLLRADADSRGVQLSWSGFGDVSGLLVRSQDEQVAQILLNVVRNALEAFGKRHGERTVHLSIRIVCEGWIAFIIDDNAGGMSQEDLSRVFEGFYTTKPDGIGIGLSISRRIAEEHGGWLALASTKGHGTRATLTLPVTATPRQADRSPPKD